MLAECTETERLAAENEGWRAFFAHIKDFALKCPGCASAGSVRVPICTVCKGTTWVFDAGKLDVLRTERVKVDMLEAETRDLLTALETEREHGQKLAEVASKLSAMVTHRLSQGEGIAWSAYTKFIKELDAALATWQEAVK